MNPVLRAFAFVVCVGWTLTANHCALEMVTRLGFLACLPDQPVASHQPSDCGDADGCATIEDGFYRPEQDQALGSQVVVSSFHLATFELSLEAMIEPIAPVAQGVAPPELARSWQFRTRTAAAVRAPSLA